MPLFYATFIIIIYVHNEPTQKQEQEQQNRSNGIPQWMPF